MIYQATAIFIALFAVIRGFRKGFTRQVPQLIGFCFGVVCAHIFCIPVEDTIRDILPSVAHRAERDYVYNILSRGMIFLIVYEVFSFCTGFLRLFFRRSTPGVFSCICGAFFSLVRYLLGLSIAYSFIFCVFPRSELLHCAKSDDGNVAGAVMLVAPAILGGETIDDLTHTLQLEEAKCIS